MWAIGLLRLTDQESLRWQPEGIALGTQAEKKQSYVDTTNGEHSVRETIWQALMACSPAHSVPRSRGTLTASQFT